MGFAKIEPPGPPARVQGLAVVGGSVAKSRAAPSAAVSYTFRGSRSLSCPSTGELQILRRPGLRPFPGAGRTNAGQTTARILGRAAKPGPGSARQVATRRRAGGAADSDLVRNARPTPLLRSSGLGRTPDPTGACEGGGSLPFPATRPRSVGRSRAVRAPEESVGCLARKHAR